jgi:signal transduction histidine kinase
MNFAEVVRTELLRIQATTPPAGADTTPGRAEASARNDLPDAAKIRLHFIEALERRQAARPSGIVETEFERWQNNDRLIRFAEALGTMLKQSIGRGATNNQLEDFIRVGIARRLGLPDSLSSEVRNLELDRLAGLAWSHSGGEPSSDWRTADEYVVAIRAVTRRDGRALLSPIAQVFLQLTGKDAIRWLLNIEAAQSVGPSDDWRVSRQTALALVRERRRTFHWDAPEDDNHWPHSWRTLRRLAAMDLVAIFEHEEAEVTAFEVLPLGDELLSEIGKGTETPMSVFAATLSQDLTAQAARTPTALPRAENKGADAATRQARLVAHEIRNALVPVRVALDGLYRDITLEPTEQVVARQRPSIDAGIHRALTFVDQLLDIATLSSTPPEPFVLEPAVHDAIAALPEVNATVEIAQQVPPLTGNRARVVLALSNLLDNARKASPGERTSVRVSATSERNGRVIVIHVDDDGPGVPADLRERVFEEAFTTTPGNSGLGLTLVREVFEAEMNGKVTCEQSPLGGARFTIRVPASTTEEA